MTEQECLGVLLDSSCPIARKADTLRRYCKDFDGSVRGNGSEPVGLRAIRSLEQHVPQDARNARPRATYINPQDFLQKSTCAFHRFALTWTLVHCRL